MQEITPKELSAWREQRDDFLLIDVREEWEREVSALPGTTNIPMRQLMADAGQVPRDRDVVLMCRSGTRTEQLATWFEQLGYDRVYNLVGGINRWAREVDPSLREY